MLRPRISPTEKDTVVRIRILALKYLPSAVVSRKDSERRVAPTPVTTNRIQAPNTIRDTKVVAPAMKLPVTLVEVQVTLPIPEVRKSLLILILVTDLVVVVTRTAHPM